MSGRENSGGAPWRVLFALAAFVVSAASVSVVSASAGGLTVVMGPAPVLMHVETQEGPLMVRRMALVASATSCPSATTSESAQSTGEPTVESSGSADPSARSTEPADCLDPSVDPSDSLESTAQPSPDVTVEPSPEVTVEPAPDASVEPTTEPTGAPSA